MKKILILISLFGAATANAQAPLDASFGNNGIARFPSFPASNCVDGSLQQDGKLLNFYYSSQGINNGFYFFRTHINGQIDTSFSSIYPNPQPGAIHGVKYIMVAGCPNWGIIRECRNRTIVVGMDGYNIMKLLPNGKTDLTFGSNGFTALNQSTTAPLFLYIRDFFEDASSANFYLGATINSDSVLLAKTDINGQPDNAHGTAGIKAIALPAALGNTSQIATVMFSRSGKIMVTGTKFGNPNGQGFICRYHLNGTLDASFGTNGLYIDASGTVESFTSIAESQNGDLFVGGLEYAPSSYFMTKMNSSGVMYNGFNSSGRKLYPYPSASHDVPYIITAPYVNTGSPVHITSSYYTGPLLPPENEQTYHSITDNGADNVAFGPNGTWNTTTNFRLAKMVAQADGKIIGFGVDSLHARIIRFGEEKPTSVAQMKAGVTSWQVGYFVNLTTSEKLDGALTNCSLFSVDGRLVKNYAASEIQIKSGGATIALPSGLAAGSYFMKMIHKGRVMTQRVVL